MVQVDVAQTTHMEDHDDGESQDDTVGLLVMSPFMAQASIYEQGIVGLM